MTLIPRNPWFWLAVLVVSIVAVQYEFPVWTPLRSLFDETLTNPKVQSFCYNLLLSLFAAHIFYILVEYLPRLRKERDASKVLNSLLAAVLRTYKTGEGVPHFVNVSDNNKDVLNINWLRQEIQGGIFTKKNNYVRLTKTVRSAHARLIDFHGALPLAVSLSPQKAIEWLEITAKVNNLADLYTQWPQLDSDDSLMALHKLRESPVADHADTINHHLEMLMFSALRWLDANAAAALLEDEKNKKPTIQTAALVGES